MHFRTFGAMALALSLGSAGSWAAKAVPADSGKTTPPAPVVQIAKAPPATLLAQNPGTPAAPAPATAGVTLPGGPFSLAFVDLVRLSQDYEGTKKGQGELDTFQQNLRKQLDDLEAIRFLDDQERTEVTTLRGAASPSPEQQKRLQDLIALSKTRGDRLRTLQQKNDKTDPEKTEFGHLTQLSAKADEDLDSLGSKLEDQLQQKGVLLSQKLTETVSTAIEAIAKEKGYSAVVDKKAVLFGGLDITDEVLKRLNATAPK